MYIILSDYEAINYIDVILNLPGFDEKKLSFLIRSDPNMHIGVGFG